MLKAITIIIFWCCSVLPAWAEIANSSIEKRDSLQQIQRDIRDSLRQESHDKIDSFIDHFDNSSHFELGTDFTSKVFYWGRTFGIKGVAFMPALTYHHKIGLYATISTTQYTDTQFKNYLVPEVDLNIGFDRTFFDYWHIQTYYDRTFALYGNKRTRNLLANAWDVNTSVDFFDYLNVEVESYLMWGGLQTKKSSIKIVSDVLSFRINKDFRIYKFLGAKIFSITPEVAVDIGDGKFARIFSDRFKGNESNVNSIATEKNTFKLLNFEAAIHFDYRIKNLDVYASPRIALPFNTDPAKLNEMSAPVFYMTAGIKYLFRITKEKIK